MKNYILVLCFSLLFVSNVYSDNYDFRKVKWGMSVTEVIQSEGRKPVLRDNTTIVYNCTIVGRKVKTAYHFVQNKLVQAFYILEDKHSNDNFFISDYGAFKKALTKKYGKPNTDEVNWSVRDSILKSDSTLWGIAVSGGILSYMSLWETSTTFIGLMLNGDNMKVRCGIGYESKALKILALQDVNEKNKRDF